MKYRQYEEYIRKLESEKEEFIQSLIEYLNFHKIALNHYRYETTEMNIQFVTKVTKIHHKVIEHQKERMKQELIERETLQNEETIYRQAIEDEHERFAQINKQYSQLSQVIKRTKNEQEKRELERKNERFKTRTRVYKRTNRKISDHQR